MSVADAWPKIFDFFGTPLGIEPAPGQRSSGAGFASDQPAGAVVLPGPTDDEYAGRGAGRG